MAATLSTDDIQQQLDNEIAAMLGWTNIRDIDGWGHWTGDPPANWRDFHGDHCDGQLPLFSSDIAAAWKVVVWLPWQWKLEYDPGGWGVFTIYVMPGEDDEEFTPIAFKFNHPTDSPLAICRASLAASKAVRKQRTTTTP